MLRNSKNGYVNIIHFSSTKSKRVSKSFPAAELFALVDGFDIGYAISHTVGNILCHKLDLIMYTDSQSLNGLCI